MTEEKAIVKFVYKPDQPIQTLENVEFLLAMGREALGDLIPADADVPRLIAEIKAAISENQKIKRCTMHSIARSAGRAAITGLHIGGPMKQADIIPRKIKGAQTACFEPRYGGMIMLACKSGKLKAVEPHVIYSNEKYEIEFGTGGYGVKHTPLMVGDRGTRVAAYVTFTMEDGAKQTAILRADEIKKREKLSQSSNANRPWVAWTDEQWLKTVIKYGLNYVPWASENMELLAAIQGDNEGIEFALDESKEGEKAGEILKAAGGLPPEAADAARQAAAEHEDVIDATPE